MKKKLFLLASLILSFAALFGTPCNAKEQSIETTQSVVENLYVSDSPMLIIGGKLLMKDQQIVSSMPEGVAFDLKTNTLSLNNYQGTSGIYTDTYYDKNAGQYYTSDIDAGIYYHGNGPLHINLLGDNSISCSGDMGLGLYTSQVIMNGPGSLTLSFENSDQDSFTGINLASDCSLFKVDSAALNICSDLTITDFCGITKKENYNIWPDGQDPCFEFLNSKINITGAYTLVFWSYGFNMGIDTKEGNLTVKDSDLTINLRGASKDVYYIATGANHWDTEHNYNKNCGGTLTIENTKINCFGGTANENGYLYCHNIIDKGNYPWYAGMDELNVMITKDIAFTPDSNKNLHICPYRRLQITPDPVDLTMGFTDVQKNDWFYRYVEYAFNNKIMTGLKGFYFGPSQNLARAQFTVIIHRLEGCPASNSKIHFSDVKDGLWYSDAILWAGSEGIVTGYSNGNFGPADDINREQMAVMMYRYADKKGYDINSKADLSGYSDKNLVSEYAQKAMEWCVAEEIITGKDNKTRLDPQGNAARAECAAIIMRFIEKYK